MSELFGLGVLCAVLPYKIRVGNMPQHWPSRCCAQVSRWQGIAAQSAPCAALRIPLVQTHLKAGGLAERLRSGLQIREDRFDSGTRLHYLAEIAGPGLQSGLKTSRCLRFRMAEKLNEREG